MWKNNCFVSYLHAARRTEAFFFGILILEGAVYSLYGLPWGPAVYTMLLSTAFFLLVWGAGFFAYRKKWRWMKQLEETIEMESVEFPRAWNGVEAQYQEIIRKREHFWREHESREQAKRKQEDAYYTRWSHQIKTPVSVMGLLLQEEEPDKEAMRHEMLQIEQYIAMALHYQKLEKGGNDLRFSHYRAGDLVKQAVRNTSELFIHKKISLQIGENLDFDVLTDEKWFVFILEQILTNAVKYTKQGGVSVFREGEGTLAVRDTGIGILPEDLPRVFEWGYTGYNGRLDKRSTGIGLSLVKSAADLLGHPVRITSEAGKGTTVRIDTKRVQLDTV